MRSSKSEKPYSKFERRLERILKDMGLGISKRGKFKGLTAMTVDLYFHMEDYLGNPEYGCPRTISLKRLCANTSCKPDELIPRLDMLIVNGLITKKKRGYALVR